LEQLVVEEVRALWGPLLAAESGEAAEEMVLRWSRRVGGRVLEAGLQARLEAEQGRRCECGGREHVHSRRPRTALTLLGPVRVVRAYLRCRRCGARRSEGEAWLGWRGTFSRRLEEAVAWEAADKPYRAALQGLRKQCGVELSLAGAQGIVARWGARELPAAPYAERVPGALVVEIDGTTAHLEEGWREVKVATCFSWDRKGPDAEPQAQTCVADWRPAAEFAQPLWQEALARGAPTAAAVAVVADGAPWIWELAHLLFPRATQILDYYHACEHVCAAAAVVHGEGSEAAHELAARWKDELWQGRSEGLQEELRELAHTARDPEGVLRKTAAYLSTHQARLRYPQFRAAGWPIASGVVEGACKDLIDLRFKRKSTRWTKAGARAVLRLRLDRRNHRWEQRVQHMRLAA